MAMQTVTHLRSVPRSATSNTLRRPPRGEESREHRSFRLQQHHQDDVRDIAHGVEESNVGICTRYLVDAATSGGRSGDPELDEDGLPYPELDDLERYCDRYGIWEHPKVQTWHRRLNRCRRAFNRLHETAKTRAVAILHVVYGPADPAVKMLTKRALDVLGQLAPLARYTEAVEGKRVELARKEAVDIVNRPAGIHSWNPRRRGPGMIEEAMRPQAEWQAQRTTAIKHGIKADHAGALLDFVMHKERYDWAMKSVTSMAALRASTDLDLGPAPSGSSEAEKARVKDRNEALEMKRDAFLVDVKLEADRMLADASRVYHGAWLQVGA